MTDDGLLGRAELERAFSALGDRLVRRGVVADLFIVGGAAMALAYDADRVTRDVDATFVPHGVVLEEARNVADAMGLPPWWLNEQASAYVSTQNDAGKVSASLARSLIGNSRSNASVLVAPRQASRNSIVSHPRAGRSVDHRRLRTEGHAPAPAISSQRSSGT
jgi:hypothetical protein